MCAGNAAASTIAQKDGDGQVGLRLRLQRKISSAVEMRSDRFFEGKENFLSGRSEALLAVSPMSKHRSLTGLRIRVGEHN
jgi:hypothetical protein